MKKKISIIIVTYNSESLIYDCLESVFKNNDIDDELEVIVVDNLSENVDSMFQNIKDKFRDDIVLVKNNINGGYGQGNNVGIRIAKGDILMIMNPDVRLVEPVFKSIISTLNKTNVVMVGLQQYITNETKGQSLLFIENSIIGLFKNKIYSLFNIFIQSEMCISGSCFFVDKKAFSELGLFDENIFMYGEELDIHKRFSKKSKLYKMVYNKSLRYKHLVSDREHSFKLESNQFRSFIYLCNKYELDIKEECKKRIRMYKFLRLKTRLFGGGDIQVLNNSIDHFEDYLKIN